MNSLMLFYVVLALVGVGFAILAHAVVTSRGKKEQGQK
jgi:hypothetical protein